MEMADSEDTLLPPANHHCDGGGNHLSNLNGPRIEIIENKGSHDNINISGGHGRNLTEYPEYPSKDRLVRLDVGGKVFVTQRSTLERIPGTRLSDLSELDYNYNKETQQWFYDRNPELFNCILDFYRCDELHFPHNFCGPSIKKELLYWKIHEGDISPCCWNRYREYEEEKKVYDNLDKAFESKTLNELSAMSNENVNPTKWQVWRRRLYVFLEEPMSSKLAQTWTLMFLGLVLMSIGILCIETHPKLRVNRPDITATTSSIVTEEAVVTHDNGTQTIILRNSTMATDLFSTSEYEEYADNLKLVNLFKTEPHPALEYIDSFCTCFFTLEFVMRLVVAPDRIKFCKSIMNIIDVLCVLPMWIKYILQIYEVRVGIDLLPVFFLLMMLRVLRICRVLRLARHYTGVKILVLALRASLRELMMLLIFVFIVMLIFSVIIYYAEFFVPDTFEHIPQGFWWVIITLTTVGYGDMYPKSGMGYLVGSMCALTGILATGLPVPIIANNFNLYYSHAQLKENIMNRKNIQDKPDPDEKKTLRLPSLKRKSQKRTNSSKSNTSSV